ncbi:MAG: DUF2723 domain-containing protein [Rhodobiaceae bacterium]|nr:DUF2723 domain-containing protein [Rhodobiaceae bacterium]
MAARPILGAVLLTLALTAVYGATASRYLDEWDSVQFALGLEDFDITRHQPHPPGYPVYIAAGKLLFALTGNATVALVALSVITGAATAGLVFLLLRRDFAPLPALAGTLTMALAPMTWMSAGKAMTDTPGLFLLAAFLLVIAAPPDGGRGEGLRFRLVAPALVGLVLGVRPHFAVIMLAMMALARRRGVWPSGRLGIEILAILVATLAWLVPAALATGGFATYFDNTLGQFLGRFHSDRVSILATPVSGWPDGDALAALIRYALIERPLTFAEVIGRHYGVFMPNLQRLTYLLDIALLAGIVVAVARLYPRRHPARLFLPALMLYFVMIFLILPPKNPRYELPVVLLFAWFVPALGMRLANARAGLAAMVAIAMVIGGMGTELAVRRAVSVPPPVAAARFIATQPEIVVIAGSMERHLRYYAPGIRVIRWGTDPESCRTALAAIRAEGDVLSDMDEICGIQGERIYRARRDRRMHEKQWTKDIYRYRSTQLPD